MIDDGTKIGYCVLSGKMTLNQPVRHFHIRIFIHTVSGEKYSVCGFGSLGSFDKYKNPNNPNNFDSFSSHDTIIDVDCSFV